MELIYLDGNFVEKGIISDFEFDLAYGKDENDYELKTAENEMSQGYYWHIADTQYGGIVDDIEGSSDSNVVTYRGRSLEGILASYSGWQLTSSEIIYVEDDNIILNGSVEDIANALMNNLGISITVNSTADDVIKEIMPRDLDCYQLLRQAFEKNNCKISFDIDGGIVLNIRGAIDYTSNQYYDVSRYVTKVTQKDLPNHLVGVFERDDQPNIVKHIYTDEKGEIQPYMMLDSNHEQPTHDLEYERVQGTPIVTGLDERVEVIKGGSKIENYDVVTRLTETDGNTVFDGNQPADWEDKVYTDYYYKEVDEETDEVSYKNFKIDMEMSPFHIPDSDHTQVWWEKNWSNCYVYDASTESNYRKLTSNDCQVTTRYVEVKLSDKEYREHYNEYYTHSYGDVYEQISGETRYKWARQFDKDKGTYWDTNRGEYYFYWEKYRWYVTFYNARGKKVKSQWVYTPSTLAVYYEGSVQSGLIPKKYLSQYSQFKGGNFTKTITIYQTKNGKKKKGVGYIKVKPKDLYWKELISLEDYCSQTNSKLQNQQWVNGKYYLRVEDPDRATYPQDRPAHIYKKVETIASAPPTTNPTTGALLEYFEEKDTIKPPFENGNTYRKVEDNYSNLVQKMLEEYEKIRNGASVVEPQMNTDVGEFDVGDIIGSVHPFTKQQLTAKINKKIVKGNSYSIEVSYEIG